MATTGRVENINLRASQKQKRLIDRAAGVLGRTRSEFMIETACREAERVLLDQRYFSLSQEAFTRFQKLLDPPLPTILSSNGFCSRSRHGIADRPNALRRRTS